MVLVGVAVGVGVLVGVAVGVAVLVGVAVGVAVGSGVFVGFRVATGLTAGVAVIVGLGTVLANGSELGSSEDWKREHPVRSIAKSIAPEHNRPIAMDFDIFASLCAR